MSHYVGGLRGLDEGMPEGSYGRFGRMFDLPSAGYLPQATLVQIARSMIKATPNNTISDTDWVDENPLIPAGYTYFGQFIAHDISFDTTALGDAERDESALTDFRTPMLDLDCVYGRGRVDQPYLYHGLRVADRSNLLLRTGQKTNSGSAPVGTRNDLLRMSDGPTMEFFDDRDGVAIIGDPRNDENKLVSQIHSAIVAFHNKVVVDPRLGAFKPDPPGIAAQFREAVKIVRWHYQWVVVHDFLNRVCEPGTKDSVLNTGGTPRLRHYPKHEATYAYMPLEFSGAAFRFGHSMVRSGYALNQFVGTGGDRIPVFGQGENLAGFSRLPAHWGVDWGYFLEGDLRPNTRPGFRVPQPSFRIDALLADPLVALPEFRDQVSPYANLAFRNLDRGQNLGLPSGQDVARAIGLEPLSDDILWDAGSPTVDSVPFSDDQRTAFESVRTARRQVKRDWVDGNGGVLRNNAPLWYYVLREAEYLGTRGDPADLGVGLGGQHLGPTGSHIVAETIIGLLWADRGSFLHAPGDFTPSPWIAQGAASFTLDRLIAFALDGT